MVSVDALQGDEETHHLWTEHADYLHTHTPLTERQSEILALRQVGATNPQIATVLDVKPATINKHWNNLTDTYQRSRELSDLFGQRSPAYQTNPDDSHDRPTWQWPWEQLATATYDVEGVDRTLRLYVDPQYHVVDYDYLLVDEHTTHPQNWRSKTTIERSVHDTTGLRNHLTANATSVFDWAVRTSLLEAAGIDPGAEGAINVDTAFGVDSDAEQVQTARTAARDCITTRDDVHRF